MFSSRTIRLGIVLVTCLAAAVCHAQQYTIAFDWQVSFDEGLTWRSGAVVVPRMMESVLVRARAEWDNVDGDVVFASTTFDATVRTVNRIAGDSVGDFYTFGWTPSNFSGFATSRFGDTLKIDDSRDASAPGTGREWIYVRQAPPTIPAIHPENPTILCQYRLQLDGIPGVRHISRPLNKSS